MAKKKSSGRDRDRDAPKKPGPRREPVYTMIAFITLVATALGCTLLYLDFDEYGQKAAPAEKAPPLPKLGGDGAAGGGQPAPAQPGL